MSDPGCYSVGWLCSVTPESVAAKTMLDGWLADDRIAEPDGFLFAPHPAVNAHHEASLDREAAHHVSRHDRGLGLAHDPGRQTRDDDIVGSNPAKGVHNVISWQLVIRCQGPATQNGTLATTRALLPRTNSRV